MNKIGLVIIAPKKIASSEYNNIVNETVEMFKTIFYYHGLDSTKDIEACFTSPLGANNYILNYIKSVVKIPIKNISMSIYNSDISFQDLYKNYKYDTTYVFCLWDGVDEVVRQQILSASKFGYNPRIKMVKRWEIGDRLFV